MEGDSRFSYGGEPSGSRMDMSMMMAQHAAIPQRSTTLTQPRIMATRGVNPLDLTSAIQHELQRSNVGHPVWGAPSNHPPPHQQQLSGSLNHASVFDSNSTGLPVPYGFFEALPQQQSIPHYIPRFEEGFPPPALHHLPTTRFEFAPETESSFRSARQGFYSGSSRSTTSGFAPSHPSEQGFEAEAQVDSMQSCSPWIERMMHADVTPTPSPINLCPSTSSQRTAGDVSCVLSQTIDLQSCHSIDNRQAQSMLRPFSSSEPYHDSTVELSADLCTDDDDILDSTRPLDVKRKKRMMSNRASAQRSRQRRQERLDQLEVLTAKLRVENSTLQKKLVTAIQLARKFEDQNKDLVKKVDRLSNELENGSKRARKSLPASKFNDCANSQQTTACASSCEMVGERPGVDPHAMRDRHTSNKDDDDDDADAAAAPTPWSNSPWGIRSPPEYHHSSHHHETLNPSTAGAAGSHQGISPVRKAFSACRMESKKRSHDHLESELGENSGGGVEPGRPLWHELCHNNSMPGSHPPSSSSLQQEDGAEADRWLEFTDCFL